jgi:lipopolysaccharide transport protein LptA
MGSLLPKLIFLLLPLVTLSSPSRAQDTDQPLPISLDANSSSFDRKTNTVTFRGLRIRQGQLSIRADEATASGLDFSKSDWSFRGHVQIALGSTRIQADEAEFAFQGHELVRGQLRGNPAVLEDQGASAGEPVTGGAKELFYSHAEGTLRLSEGAWVHQGPNEITGCDLIYDIAEQKVTSGSSECGEPVRITILPPADREDAATQP